MSHKELTLLGAAIDRCNRLDESEYETRRRSRDLIERMNRAELMRARRAARKHARALLANLARELGIEAQVRNGD